MKRQLIRGGMQVALRTMAGLARVEGPAQTLARVVIHSLGHAVSAVRAASESRDPAALGDTWQEAFAAKKQVPIVALDERTAYAEIRTPCPLRGSGDVDACYRMMGYDRAFLERANANLIVLRSQAEPNVEVCRVAIRHKSHSTDDLIPAHLKRRD